jgi:hypothetical protein
MDESNTHDGTDFVTVGAAWAEDTTWRAWAIDWLAAIQPLAVFHSYDVWNRKNNCDFLTRDSRDELVNRSMKVIAKHQIRGRIGEVDRRLLERELGGHAKTMSLVEHPYYLPFIWTIHRTMELLKAENVQKATFYHENNDFMEGAKEHFEIRKANLGCLEYEFRFSKKSDCVQLQCADVFAYFGMQRLRKPKIDPIALAVADGHSNRIQALTVKTEQLVELAKSINSMPI